MSDGATASRTWAAADPAAYEAAMARSAWCDRSDRVRIRFSGPQAALTLNGLLTNDIASLKPGAGLYAAALTAKGKIIADVRVLASDDGFMVNADAAAGPPLLAMLRKYVNPRLASFRDITADTCEVRIAGPGSAQAVGEVALDGLPPFAHLDVNVRGHAAQVVRAPDLGVMAFDLLALAPARAAMVPALEASGAVPLDAGTAEVLRVEAGWPRYSLDMDDAVLAQEAGLDRLGGISFDKGCYTGQETVARIRFRGHVNRTLRGLRAAAPVTPGAELHSSDGAPVGTVRSSAVSPRFGPIALAYVRREVEDGVSVSAAMNGRQVIATITALPFR